jgi:hypothetical protein
MKTMLIARLRHLILGPGRHHRRMKRPEPERVTPEQFRLMFSGQGADRKYYPEKNGCREEYIVW